MDRNISFAHLFLLLLLTSLQLSESLPNSSIPKFQLALNYVGSTSILSELKDLSRNYNTVSLGEGFPDFNPPDFVKHALENITADNNPLLHQYSRNPGNIRLVNALAKVYSKLLNRELDPLNNFIVTIGGTEALFLTFQTHTFPGDEWIIIEPAFEAYAPMVRMAGGKPRFLTLKLNKTSSPPSSADWIFDKEELAKLFNDKTKGILINTPHNPTGKMFTRNELQYIADLATKWNTLVIADEVYELLAYDSNEHIRIATLPGMFERTITISSASKTFCVTGWRVGWAYGPTELIDHLKVGHVKMVFYNPTPLQEAIAIAIENELLSNDKAEFGVHLKTFVKEMQNKRDFMVKSLVGVGMEPTVPQGGYFIVSNWTSIASQANLADEHDEFDDVKFAKWMIKNVGLVSTPTSIWFDGDRSYENQDFIRFCFTKQDETLKKAKDVLSKLKKP